MLVPNINVKFGIYELCDLSDVRTLKRFLLCGSKKKRIVFEFRKYDVILWNLVNRQVHCNKIIIICYTKVNIEFSTY